MTKFEKIWTLDEVHDSFVQSTKKDLENCHLRSDIHDSKWSGRFIFIDNDIEAQLYVRFMKNQNNFISYVIANISVGDEFCGGGLIEKLIKTIEKCAPDEITDLSFECVNNKRLFNNLLKRGFKEDNPGYLNIHLIK